MLNEDKIIHHLKLQSAGFIGDDAVVLPQIMNTPYLLTKDLLVEGIHFRVQYFTPQDLAHKALHVNLSDLAAMGAEPLYVLCGISIPGHLQEYSTDFLNGLSNHCNELGIILIGGDTTASQQQLFISITAVGRAPEHIIKYRSQSQNHDVICIAGNLGFAHLGFLALENKTPAPERYLKSFLRPEARIKEGLWLADQPCITSMMDVSDGLYIDLTRLCKASNKGAVIDIDMLQDHLESDVSIQTALEGGEDYSLLFTVASTSIHKLSQQFLSTFNYKLKVIGFITEGDRILFKEKGNDIELKVNPFTHFGEHNEV